MINTIRLWLQSILGTYTPQTYEAYVVAVGGDGTSAIESFDVIPAGMAGLDWEYIFTAVLLLIVIYSVFRLLGVLLQSLSGGRRV